MFPCPSLPWQKFSVDTEIQVNRLVKRPPIPGSRLWWYRRRLAESQGKAPDRGVAGKLRPVLQAAHQGAQPVPGVLPASLRSR